MVTSDQLELALGSRRNWASEELLTTLNTLEVDGADLVRENWLTHANILREGTYSMEQYMNAIKYVSLKQMGHTNAQAYSIALADRYQALVAAGHDEKRISSHIAAFHKGALVQKLLAQSTIPLYMLYQDEAHKAITKLASVMTNPDASFRTQVEAADKLLGHIKRTEAAKIELSVTQAQTDGMNELQNMMRDLAARQLAAIAAGGNVQQVANLPVKQREPVLIEQSPGDTVASTEAR
jgi:hypothetical protein